MAPSSPSSPTSSFTSPQTAPVLADVVRSGFHEGQHRGSLVVLGADGRVERAWGDPAAPVFPRSANKPAQAAAVLRAGEAADGAFSLGGERLALTAASHSGESFHLELVRRMLDEAGLTESDLRCPEDLPLDPVEAERYLAAGHRRSRVAMNCSGKHTSMLAACRANGWPTDSYVDPAHPLQQLTERTLAEAAGEPVAHTGTDGCGAPLLAVSLTGLARMYRTFATADPATPEGRVARAMSSHPEYVAGTRRHDTAVMRELPGALAKMGVEAVQAVALPDGRALAFKLEDGGGRAVGPVLLRGLELLGVEAAVLERLAERLSVPLLGGGEPVGEVRAAF
ncbi:asparaginase [Streptomyces sp. HNM0574]|uniref:asparaginase n=1 Tax=Streptomyces sp. HNM0574 TaxID=2714954 RepID=UPI00146E2C4C|nr:asparaginase [Streptomyces sp. HNM0574]NLU67994.1 asparaginase [Streptomyces sp. HNM0574]